MKETLVPAGLERRKEDYELISRPGRYVDDLKGLRERPVQMVFARSMYAHARIKGINLEAVRALPGVVAAFSGGQS
jgi:CO/xanthine dehydrogenase Mo-binding subunit